ncbi:hypothetical protein M569_11095 [Genlisea aurea]|uniref:Uncharacterized protein n=1 Tax=Genlisea aurea TaxID=192259 RepID=S8C9T0_9LAMI|nr:hypothetical protein M569_11095 [Genlisea aurea]
MRFTSLNRPHHHPKIRTPPPFSKKKGEKEERRRNTIRFSRARSEMDDDQYGISDLRHFISGRSLFPSPEILADHRCVVSQPAAVGGGGFDVVGVNSGGGDGGTGRWPRQETLTLLEIRSRLDPKFKEANQKGPLWDEISRFVIQISLS